MRVIILAELIAAPRLPGGDEFERLIQGPPRPLRSYLIAAPKAASESTSTSCPRRGEAFGIAPDCLRRPGRVSVGS